MLVAVLAFSFNLRTLFFVFFLCLSVSFKSITFVIACTGVAARISRLVIDTAQIGL